MKLNAYGGVMDESGEQLSVREAIILRSLNGPDMVRLANEKGWSDEQAAAHYNGQHGPGGFWTGDNFAELRANNPVAIAAGAVAFTTEVTLGGTRYSVTYTPLA